MPKSVALSLLALSALLTVGSIPATAQAPTELFISEYVEGSSNNKAVELFNGTGTAIDLGAGAYQLEIYFNGNSSAGNTIALAGVLADGATFVVADDSADPIVLAAADLAATGSFFNGDDAIVLRKGGAVVDALGQVGFDPGSQWGSGLVSTQDNTLRRQAAICAGDTDETDVFDPSLEWDGFAQNTFDGLGSHAVTCTGGGGPGAATLLLSEIVVTPTGGEMIEIFNPTAAAIDLTDVYLTDATFSPGGAFYYNIVTGDLALAGGGGFGDFHARFPAGVSIAPGELQTISMPGSDSFQAAYGFLPTYELFEDGAGADGVADMVEALPGSINNQGALTNSGEVVVLYTWDGASDLVQDLDYALWGDKNEAVDKTGVAVDGPDADAIATAYAADTAVGSQDVIDTSGHAVGAAWHRVDFDEGVEAKSGGNGATGHNETSEDVSNTWSELPPSPSTGVPVPPPAALLLTELVVTPTAGEYVEIHNPTGASVDLSLYYLTDATFASGGAFYYNIVTGNLALAGGGGFGDFHARFPAGASIAAGEFQTVALAGSDDFTTTYGSAPTYELFEDGDGADGIPDMLEALPGSINNQGGLTNGGEIVVLYYWDGASDLVTDIDYALWGDKDEAVDKTGVAVDGPDADAVATSYQPDTPVAAQDVIATGGHASGETFQRTDLTEGAEVQVGSNGVGGADETSEDLSNTWSDDDAATPGSGAPTGWVINEIHADPAGNTDCTGFGLPPECGDANGDGVRETADDEFVEIVNITGSDQDISGWTVTDGFGLRHTFPAGTVLSDNCAIVLFGNGPLQGSFGGALAQDASSGSLGLNNGGDSVTFATDGGVALAAVTYGSEGGTNQSLTRDPDITGAFVLHTTATDSGGSLFSPGTLADGTPFSGCQLAPNPAEIWQLQGAGLQTPFPNQQVTTEDNVVFAVAPEGFFIQTPAARTDGDPETSDGIFVFTGAAPAVTVGDQVDVTGVLAEFFNLTEISGSVTVTIDSSGNALPVPVTFDATTPSPNQPQPANELERYEGMLVEVFGATASGPSNQFGDVPVVATSDRPFREPGIAFPGLPGLPVWDGNPEIFEIDPDGLGLPDLALPAGATITLARGPLNFAFGDYQILPSELIANGTIVADPVRDKAFGEFTVGTQNLLRIFDDVDDPGISEPVTDPAEYDALLDKVSLYIRTVAKAPDILGVQEVENLNVLQDIADRIFLDDPTLVYTPYLEEGNDIGGIDVGFLVLDTVFVSSVTQFFKTETFTFNGNTATTHDRPPLVLEGEYVGGPGAAFPIVVIVNHLRSLNNIDDPADGGRVRAKRDAQATDVSGLVQDFQDLDPNVHLAAIGDFNAFEFTDGYVHVIGQIIGDPADASQALLPGTDQVDPNLDNRILDLPAEERYTFVFQGSAQVLDHILTSQALAPNVSGIEVARANADTPASFMPDPTTPLRTSDHDGVVLYIATVFDGDGDGVTDDLDICPGTTIPEAYPTKKLLPFRYALVDGDNVFDTKKPPFFAPTFDTADTGGCSCEQIVEATGLQGTFIGKIQARFGCNLLLMHIWSYWVSQVSEGIEATLDLPDPIERLEEDFRGGRTER